MNALLARDVRGRGFRAPAGTLATLISNTQPATVDHPGMWLVFVRDLRGHDRATYLRGDALILDPHPDLHLEEA